LTLPAPRALLPASSGRAVLAAQEAGRQRVEVDHAHLLPHAQRLQFALEHGPVVQVVERLQAFVARQAQALAGGQRFGQPRGAVVGGAEARTLPCATSSANACSVASSGVSVSSLWAW
jgi:hypothetical protein